MAGQKIANLKLAAKDLIDTVIWDNQTADYYSKVAIVPYAAGVNVNAGQPSPSGYADLIASGTAFIPSPDVNSSNSRMPDTPGVEPSYDQPHVCVGTDRPASLHRCCAQPTGLLNLVGANYPPPLAGNPCPVNPITPLTNNKTDLKNQIDLLLPQGARLDILALAWGWYLLSPNWGDLWPSASQRGSVQRYRGTQR